MNIVAFLIFLLFPLSIFAGETCLIDVKSSISSISSQGESKVFHTSDFLKKREYSKSILNIFGLNNHLQGLVYHPKTQVFYISGGDFKNKESMLLSLNNDNGRYEAFQRIKLDNELDLWHLGGINIFEDILVAPLEKMGPGDKKSVVQLLDISDPKNIRTLPNSFSRLGISYGSADIIKKNNLYYLIAVNSSQLDIFTARSLTDEFTYLKSIKGKVFKASYIKVFQQCNGETFIANFSPKRSIAGGKKNILGLFNLDINASSVNEIQKYTFHCDKKCGFRGAVGVYQRGQKLELISSKQNKEKDPEIHFKHFTSF